MIDEGPPKVMSDGPIPVSGVLWVWFKKLYGWARGEANVNTAITATTLQVVDNFYYPCDCTANNIAVTLPPVSANHSKKYLIKKIDATANIVTITPGAGDTIDGVASITISLQWDALFIVSDGVHTWHIINTSTVSPLVPDELPISVKDYGAVGDGVTDDTVAIQAALNSGKSGIWFPRATYRTTAALTITGPDRGIIYGNGSIIQLDNAGAVSNIVVNNHVYLYTIRDLTVYRAQAASGFSAGFYMGWSAGCKLVNCEVVGNNQIWCGVAAMDALDLTIQACRIEHCISHGVYSEGTNGTTHASGVYLWDTFVQYNGGNGVYVFDYNNAFYAYRNIIYNNTGWGIAMDATVLANSSGDVEVADNSIDTNIAGGVYLSKYSAGRINNNWFSSNTGNNIRQISDSNSLTINNNMMYGDSSHVGLDLAGPHNVISGNFIYYGNGIIKLASTANYTAITGNSLTNSTTYAIDTAGAPDTIAITGNVFRDNVTNINAGATNMTAMGNQPMTDDKPLGNVSGLNFYTVMYDASGLGNIWTGGTGDPTNYIQNTTHIFTDRPGTTTWLTIDTSRSAFTHPVQMPTYAFASLPGSPAQGDRAICNNSNTAVFNAVAAGGGANIVPVFYNGTTWRVG